MSVGGCSYQLNFRCFSKTKPRRVLKSLNFVNVKICQRLFRCKELLPFFPVAACGARFKLHLQEQHSRSSDSFHDVEQNSRLVNLGAALGK